jgi:hypothetical protein
VIGVTHNQARPAPYGQRAWMWITRFNSDFKAASSIFENRCIINQKMGFFFEMRWENKSFKKHRFRYTGDLW